MQRDESRHTKHTRKLNAQLNKVEKVRFKDGMNETFNFANSDLNTLPPAINRVPIIGKLATSRMGYTSTEGFDLKTRMFSSVNSTIDNPKTSLKTRPFESITKFTDKDNSSIGLYNLPDTRTNIIGLGSCRRERGKEFSLFLDRVCWLPIGPEVGLGPMV